MSAMSIVPLFFAQDSTAEIATGAAAAVEISSVWDFVVKGGPVMIPIGICSLLALTVFVERMISLRRSRIAPADLWPRIESVLTSSSPSRMADARQLCAASPSPLARILDAGLKRMHQPADIVEKHLREQAERESLGMRKHLRLLAVIGSIAPLLGLLGTIFGMIAAFQTVAASPEALGRTELLAGGIYEAMITTAAGLLVAIPAVIAWHMASAKADRLLADLDQPASDFLERFAAPAADRHLPRPRPASHNGQSLHEISSPDHFAAAIEDATTATT